MTSGYSNSPKCPACGSNIGKIADTRLNGTPLSLRRRRECVCGHRWRTVEVSEDEFHALEARVKQADQAVANIRSLVAEPPDAPLAE